MRPRSTQHFINVCILYNNNRNRHLFPYKLVLLSCINTVWYVVQGALIDQYQKMKANVCPGIQLQCCIYVKIDYLKIVLQSIVL